MSWRPITEKALEGEISRGFDQMTPEQRCLWNAIKIRPTKWHLSTWGDMGGGFWVVAIVGQIVIWYNDIEGGFNRSRYSSFGVIDEYWCNQDELNWTVGHMVREIATGQASGDLLGPPEPIA